jgi:hypothetical protein
MDNPFYTNGVHFVSGIVAPFFFAALIYLLISIVHKTQQ